MDKTTSQGEDVARERVAVFDDVPEIVVPLERAYRVAAFFILLAALCIVLSQTAYLSSAVGLSVATLLFAITTIIGIVGARRVKDQTVRLAIIMLTLASVGGGMLAFALMQAERQGASLIAQIPLLPMLPLWLAVLAPLGIAIGFEKLYKRVTREGPVASSTPKLPVTANKLERGAIKLVTTDELKAGHSIVLRDGDIVPVDGAIVEGSGEMIERIISGAQEPTRKIPGSLVYAGAQVISGRYVVAVRAVGAQTLVGKLLEQPAQTIVAMNETASARTRSSILITGVLVSVGLGGIMAVTVGGVFACMSVIGGLLATSAGLLTLSTSSFIRLDEALGDARVRTPHAVERLLDVDTIVLERSGVITTGAITVEHVVSFKPYTQQQVLNLAAAIEQHAEAASGKAIVAFSKKMGAISLQRVEDIQEEESAGVRGRVNGKELVVGSVGYARRLKVKIPKDALEHTDDGKSIVIVALDKDAIGFIALRDSTREETSAAVATLRTYGTVVMLTSEHEATAAAHARDAGITEVLANVAPARKGAALATLRSDGKKVALVGYTPRAEAHVNITLFDSARMDEEAHATTDVFVRSDDLTAVSTLIANVRTYKKELAHTRSRAVFGVIIGIVTAPVGVIGSLLVKNPDQARTKKV